MRKGWLWAVLLISGCHSPGIEQRQGFTVDHSHTSRAQQSRIRLVVLHYTAENNARSLEILSGAGVSAHYLIPSPAENGGTAASLYQLVPESQAAWHAGVSYWRGITNLNNSSLGIELVNPGYYRKAAGSQCMAYPRQQITVLRALLHDIVKRYAIKPWNIVGHSDIAPSRKQDPGPCFPWQTLAKDGLGAWPNAATVKKFLAGKEAYQEADQLTLIRLLSRYGYEVSEHSTAVQQKSVIRAFQMHFRPAMTSGNADAETLAIARALLQKYGPGGP